MGSAIERAPIPLVEIGAVPELFFTDIEVEVVAGRCARFLLVSEQRPVDCADAPPERVLRLRCVTPVELVPRMIRKTCFALGRYWGAGAVKGLLLPR